MSNLIKSFTKEFAYLICVDSDGCVMDTMEIKHRKCFAPTWIKVFELEKYTDQCMELWLNINLYSMTRGINRFKGLAIALNEISSWKDINLPSGLYDFVLWTENTLQLSNKSLSEFLQKKECCCAKRALEWSILTNESIEQLAKHSMKPFKNVNQVLQSIALKADIVGVSSANKEAVENEWAQFGILNYCKTVLCQENGSKSSCISQLLEHGYNKKNCLMVGDAPGDYKAAIENGIWFYPVIPKNEVESWKVLLEETFPKLLDGKFTQAYQNNLIEKFYCALGKSKIKEV